MPRSNRRSWHLLVQAVQVVLAAVAGLLLTGTIALFLGPGWFVLVAGAAGGLAALWLLRLTTGTRWRLALALANVGVIALFISVTTPRFSGSPPTAVAPLPIPPDPGPDTLSALPDTIDASSPDSATVDPYELRDRLRAMLDPGRLAYNPPDTLRLGEETEMELLISADTTAGRLSARFAPADSVVEAPVAISPVMSAQLVVVGDPGEGGVLVDALTPPTQSIGGKKPGRWRWRLQATRGGDYDLILTVNATIEAADGQTVGEFEQYSDRLHVRVTGGQRLAGLWRRNWGWLLALLACVIPFVIYRLERRHSAAGTSRLEPARPSPVAPSDEPNIGDHPMNEAPEGRETDPNEPA